MEEEKMKMEQELPEQEAEQQESSSPAPAEEQDAVQPEDDMPRTVSNQGLMADAFSGDTTLRSRPEQREGLEGEEGIRIQYGFHADEIKTGLKIFQREMLYKRYLIYSLILGVIFVIYLVTTIRSPGSKFNLFMTVLCLIVLLFIWYFPIQHIRQVVKSVNKMEYREDFILTVYDSGIDVGTDDSNIIYLYQKDPVRVWETDDLFIIGYEKVRIFVIPKRCCAGQEAAISEKLQKGAGEKYKRIQNRK